jgi:co-chaperonin GroES (HSP10)
MKKKEEGIVPKVKDIEPIGTQVLIETLTQQEVLGTKLQLPENEVSNKQAPQGYVVGMGPKVQIDWGFGVGDRVIVTGNYTPVPEFRKGHRSLILVDPHQIKAVLKE